MSAQSNVLKITRLSRAKRIKMQGIYELLVAIFRFVSFEGEKVSLGFENIINEEGSIAMLPVHQNVYFVPLIC